MFVHMRLASWSLRENRFPLIKYRPLSKVPCRPDLVRIAQTQPVTGKCQAAVLKAEQNRPMLRLISRD